MRVDSVMPERQVRESPAESHGKSGEISVLWILAVLMRQRRIVIAFTAIGVVVALVVALLRERTYSATFSFVPQAGQDATPASLSSLAGQFGLSLGAPAGVSQSSQLYADLLRTREVLVPIARDSFAVFGTGSEREPLASLLHISASSEALVLEKTLRALRTRVIFSTVATRTTGVVSVRVRTRFPSVSLEVANRLLQGVNEFNLVTRQSQAAEERRFTEGRLDAARTSLRSAEDALERFLRTNRQFENAPGLIIERDRLQRDVVLRQQIVTGLAQHYEDARVREVRDTPVITVIEKPVLPVEPDPRGRVSMLVGGSAIALLAGIVAALFANGIGQLQAAGTDPSFNLLIKEWKRFRGVRK